MTEKYKKLYKNRGIAMGISLVGTWKVILTDGTAAQMHLPGTLDESGIGHIRINTLELDSLVLFLPQKECSHKFRWQWRSVWTVPLCLSRVLFHIPQTLWHIPAGFLRPIPSTYAPNLCTDTAIAVHSSPVPVLRSATGKLLQKQCRRI